MVMHKKWIVLVGLICCDAALASSFKSRLIGPIQREFKMGNQDELSAPGRDCPDLSGVWQVQCTDSRGLTDESTVTVSQYRCNAIEIDDTLFYIGGSNGESSASGTYGFIDDQVYSTDWNAARDGLHGTIVSRGRILGRYDTFRSDGQFDFVKIDNQSLKYTLQLTSVRDDHGKKNSVSYFADCQLTKVDAVTAK